MNTVTSVRAFLLLAFCADQLSPEAYLIERELFVVQFQGLIVIHTADEVEGLQAGGLWRQFGGGDPLVMDLPSIAKVTKLPQEKLEALSKNTPVFAPGLPYAPPIGSIAEIMDSGDLAARLAATLEGPAGAPDHRDKVGLERKGRLKAAEIAQRVEREAISAYV